MTPRRTLVLTTTLAAVAGGVFAAGAALGAGEPAQIAAPVQRVEQYYAVGPSAEYSGDSGGIGTVSPLRFVAPGSATAAAVIEVSFEYRTRGDGPFVMSAKLKDVGGPKVALQPGEVTLAPSPSGASTTVRFLAPEVTGGDTYKASVGVNAVPSGHGPTHITTHKMLVTVDLD